MRFTPLSDEQIQFEGLLPEGNYDFEVVNAEEKQSKAGNDMIEIILKIWDQNGNPKQQYDWLLEAFAKKLKHFCDVAGLQHKYRDGTLQAQDCIGKTGKLWLIRTPAQNGYDASNKVSDYVIPDSNKTKEPKLSQESPKKDDFEDSDIPF